MPQNKQKYRKIFCVTRAVIIKNSRIPQNKQKISQNLQFTAAFNMKTTATAVEKQKWLSYNKSFTKVLTASPISVDPHFFVS